MIEFRDCDITPDHIAAMLEAEAFSSKLATAIATIAIYAEIQKSNALSAERNELERRWQEFAMGGDVECAE